MKKKNLLLEIELIPATCWWSNVRSNINRIEWDIIRNDVLINKKKKCTICNSEATQCHEKFHYDDSNHIQTLIGFEALCHLCHDVKHIGLAGIRGMSERARERFKKINKLSSKNTKIEINKAISIWIKRSKVRWKLNLDYLNKYGINISKDNIDREKKSILPISNGSDLWKLYNVGSHKISLLKSIGINSINDLINFNCNKFYGAKGISRETVIRLQLFAISYQRKKIIPVSPFAVPVNDNNIFLDIETDYWNTISEKKVWLIGVFA